MCNGLEHEVDPFPKPMWEAAYLEAYWAGWEVTISWWFVYLVGYVESSKGGCLIMFEVVFNVVRIMCRKGVFVLL